MQLVSEKRKLQDEMENELGVRLKCMKDEAMRDLLTKHALEQGVSNATLWQMFKDFCNNVFF